MAKVKTVKREYRLFRVGEKAMLAQLIREVGIRAVCDHAANTLDAIAKSKDGDREIDREDLRTAAENLRNQLY